MSKKESSKNDPKNETTRKDSRKLLKGNAGENEQARQLKEREMIDNLNRQNIEKYFTNYIVKSEMGELANKVTAESLQRVTQNLKRGEVEMPQNALPLPQLSRPEPKLTYQQQKHLEIKAQREQMQKKMDYLYEQIRPQAIKNQEKGRHLQVEVKEILTKEEHERRMQNILSDKAELKKRIEEHQEEETKKTKEEQEQRESLKKIEEQKIRQQRRSLIELKMKKRKEEHEKFIEQQKQLQKKFGSVKLQSRLYIQMEEKFKSEVLMPILQEKKHKLKELRQFHKRYELEAVKEHEKKYLMRSLEKERTNNSDEPKWNYEPPPRSQRLAKVLEEEKIELERQIRAKKLRNEERQKRQAEYVHIVKVKHQPKIDPEKRIQIEHRKLMQLKKLEKKQIDKKKLGEGYLQQAKRMRRAETVRSEPKQGKASTVSDNKQSRTLATNPYHYHSHEFYENMRRKKMESILNAEDSSINEKYMKMRYQVDKLNEKFKQKEEIARYNNDEESQGEAAELLLSSIKAKMGIMGLLKKNIVVNQQEQ